MANALGHLFLATEGGGIFKSTDGGLNWLAINAGLLSVLIAALLLDPATGYLYAGARDGLPFAQSGHDTDGARAAAAGGGVYVSTDDGASWALASGGLNAPSVTALHITPNGDFIAGASGQSVFTTSSPTVAGEPEGSIRPDHHALRQNYPNPFNPETVIRFQLAAPGEVELIVINVLGQDVRTLQSGHMPAGSHEVQWDGKNSDGADVASGVYYYRLNVGDTKETRSMVLVR